MTAQEKLDEIKKLREKCFTPQHFEIHANEVDWLIARVEKLTEALEEILEQNTSFRDRKIAKKALEE